jgi:hypothetical protein
MIVSIEEIVKYTCGGEMYMHLHTHFYVNKKINKKHRIHREKEGMESASEMVAFPLLPTPIESNYRACTIPYRFPSDNPRKPTPTELSWIDLFLNSIPSFKYLSFPFKFLFCYSFLIDLYQLWVFIL